MIKKLLKWLFYTVSAFFIVLIIVFLSLIRPDIPVEKLKEDYTNHTSRFIEIDGMQVHIQDEGDGPAVFLIHGTFASLHTWDEWTEALSDSFRVIRLDLPGFGLTGPHPQNDYSTRSTLYLFEEIRQYLGVESWVVAGNSLGARFAAEYARHFPDNTEAVVFLNGAGGLGNPSQREVVNNQISTSNQNSTAQPQRQSIVWKALGNQYLRKMMSITTPRFAFSYSLKEVYADPHLIEPETIDRYYNLLRREGNRQSFLARNQGVLGDRSTIPELPTPAYLPDLEHPTLIIWGEKDRWVPVQTANRLKQLLPHARLIIYPNAGHVPMEEIPTESVKDFRTFLNEVYSLGYPSNIYE